MAADQHAGNPPIADRQANSWVTARSAGRWRVGKGYTQTSTALALYRIVFALLFLFILGPGRYGPGVTSGEVGDLPAGMFHPPLGPGMLFSAWPAEGVIIAVELILAAALFAILIGAFTRAASLTTAGCGLILTTLLYSEGKIDHAILWTVIVPAVMAWTSWGDTWSVDASRERVRRRKGFQSDTSRPIALVALALGVVFGTAAALKALSGWLEPATSSTLGWVFAQAVQEGRVAAPPPFLSATPGVVWLVIDYATVIFEAGLLIAALRRHWLIPYLFVAALFHCGASLLGFPPFFEIIAIYLLFVRLDPIVRRIRRPLDAFARLARDRPAAVCVVTTLVWALYSFAALTMDGPLTIVWLLGALNIPGVLLWLMLWPTVIAVSVIVYMKRSVPPEDRLEEHLPAWALPAALAVLAGQSALTLLVSEPYPALTGPRFFGSFDDGRTVNIAEQRISVITDGRRIPVDNATLFDMSRTGSVQLGGVRFSGPALDASGQVVFHPSLQDRLRNQYHRFSSDHLPRYGGQLSTDEKRWLRGNLAQNGVSCDSDCSLEVEWRRLSFDRATGDLVGQNVISQDTYALR